MYRLLVGFLIVTGPVQVGLAFTLIGPGSEQRSQLPWVLSIALALGLKSALQICGQSAHNAAKTAHDLLYSSYVAPLVIMAVLRLTWGGAVSAEWHAFEASYLRESIPTPAEASPRWGLTPIRGMPGMPVAESGSAFRRLIAAVVMDGLRCSGRILLSTPGWAYLGSLIVAACFRPLPSVENP